MPQLLAIALIGGVVWYAYRAFKKEMARVAEEVQRAEAKKEEQSKLVQGEDGIYRPADRDK